MEACDATRLVGARERAAKAVEGYPVDASSPSYRFMGFVPLFKRAGFRAAEKRAE